jgi:hypothetical protein
MTAGDHHPVGRDPLEMLWFGRAPTVEPQLRRPPELPSNLPFWIQLFGELETKGHRRLQEEEEWPWEG